MFEMLHQSSGLYINLRDARSMFGWQSAPSSSSSSALITDSGSQGSLSQSPVPDEIAQRGPRNDLDDPEAAPLFEDEGHLEAEASFPFEPAAEEAPSPDEESLITPAQRTALVSAHKRTMRERLADITADECV